ncbi:hypothetical protein CGMCC3_g153 [Colletotrichum fructicola]|uniref:Uncharacterized protein n=1 Tax=Colletotrichum fructicola (strain Nara gc5) TaxID=1213859 RepID=A0A7J6JBS7_COLFN|nr:uncharacterized protein CGMCC3_g153 [Colletotrichum fructicola]KAF4486616.1 hypothetical protein CGGC5_v004779 [Colletotrichum fructicola Nara gc5]KAI8276006.1 hypothetical protein K4K60_008199 [Colletotrichum sp. SAR11_57]KAE9583993.1 hypothetical protein CGMCC3_g153 [Colletotrichum fructicola]KAF4414267.1 hypothetical protein CFRS1_v014232 [Colletotrichum fructicola]KAF4893679.1 hypothetical protein CGCFRS4_v006962 [Colletotrichum fructicola]
MSEQRLVFHPRHSLVLTTDFIYNAVKIDDAGEALEAVCGILSVEAKVHAGRDTGSQNLDQATYLVGWHDAIHSLRNFILARRDFHMNKNTHIHDVPMCMSFPLTATIPEAAIQVASRGTVSLFHIPEGPLFAPSGAEKQADDGFIVVSSSSGTPFNTPTTSSFLQNSSSAPTAQDSQLQTSKILAGMDTKTILMNYEREARESEHRIAAEIAKMSLMREAIFSDRFFGKAPLFPDQEAAGINGSFVSKQQEDRAVDAVNQIFRNWRVQVPPTTRPTHTEPTVRNLGLFGGALRNLQSNRPAVPQSPGNAGTFGGPSVGSPIFSPSQPNNTNQAPPRSQPSLFNYASMQSTAPRSQPNPTPPAPLLEWQLDQLLQDRNDTHDLKELWQSYQPGPSFIERNGVLLPPPDATPSAGSSKSFGSSGPPQTFGRRMGSGGISNGGQRQSRREQLARSSIFHVTYSTPSTIPTSTQGTLSQAPRQQPASSSSSMVPSQDVSEREIEAMYREGDHLLDFDAGSRTTADRSTRRSQAELARQAARDLRARVRARRAMEQAQTCTPESSDSLMTAPSPSPTSSSTEPAELDACNTQLAPKAAAPTPPSRPSLFEKALSPEEYNPAPVRGGPASGRGGLFGEALYNPAPARGNVVDNTIIPKAAAPAPGRSSLFGESARRPCAGGGLFGTGLAPSQQGPSGIFASQLPYHSTREESSRRSTDEKEGP